MYKELSKQKLDKGGRCHVLIAKVKIICKAPATDLCGVVQTGIL